MFPTPAFPHQRRLKLAGSFALVGGLFATTSLAFATPNSKPCTSNDEIMLTLQMQKLVKIDSKTVEGETIQLPRTFQTELRSLVQPNGQEVLFLSEGENITYLEKTIHHLDGKTGRRTIDLVPGDLQTGLSGTYTASRLPNNDVKIDVSISDVKVDKIVNCMDTQCPVRVEQRSGQSIILTPNQAISIDIAVADNKDEAVRLIFSRKEIPLRAEPKPHGISVHRT